MILAGDIGGTKTNLALFHRTPSGLEAVEQRRYPTPGQISLENTVATFLEEVGSSKDSIDAAAFGIAGPVIAGVIEAPNLPWVARIASMRRFLATEKVEFLNDLTANGFGIPVLQEDQTALLKPGDELPDENGALISAGTGLGQAFLYCDDREWLAVPSEGGHSDFAPRDELECELLLYLRKRLGRVSYERVLSGPGLARIYGFLRDTGRGAEPAWLQERLAEGDPSAEISKAALAGESELCDQAMNMFVSFYGAEAGNLALRCQALGGIYLGGGIAPKILDRLKSDLFLESFLEKGRLRGMLERIPIRVILEPKAALLGAARCADLLLRRQHRTPASEVIE